MCRELIGKMSARWNARRAVPARKIRLRVLQGRCRIPAKPRWRQTTIVPRRHLRAAARTDADAAESMCEGTKRAAPVSRAGELIAARDAIGSRVATLRRRRVVPRSGARAHATHNITRRARANSAVSSPR